MPVIASDVFEIVINGSAPRRPVSLRSQELFRPANAGRSRRVKREQRLSSVMTTRIAANEQRAGGTLTAHRTTSRAVHIISRHVVRSKSRSPGTITVGASSVAASGICSFGRRQWRQSVAAAITLALSLFSATLAFTFSTRLTVTCSPSHLPSGSTRSTVRTRSRRVGVASTFITICGNSWEQSPPIPAECDPPPVVLRRAENGDEAIATSINDTVDRHHQPAKSAASAETVETDSNCRTYRHQRRSESPMHSIGRLASAIARILGAGTTHRRRTRRPTASTMR